MPFNPSTWNSYFHQGVDRPQTDQILSSHENGAFLIRPSVRVPGDLVLAVKEPVRVKHYLINKLPNDSFKIGDQIFNTIEEMLMFYTTHYLDSEVLKEPVLVNNASNNNNSKNNNNNNNNNENERRNSVKSGNLRSISDNVSTINNNSRNNSVTLQNSQRRLSAKQIQVVTLYDFAGQDDEDLPFKRGEILRSGLKYLPW